jgi:hypothetical protein
VPEPPAYRIVHRGGDFGVRLSSAEVEQGLDVVVAEHVRGHSWVGFVVDDQVAQGLAEALVLVVYGDWLPARMLSALAHYLGGVHLRLAPGMRRVLGVFKRSVFACKLP